MEIEFSFIKKALSYYSQYTKGRNTDEQYHKVLNWFYESKAVSNYARNIMLEDRKLESIRMYLNGVPEHKIQKHIEKKYGKGDAVFNVNGFIKKMTERYKRRYEDYCEFCENYYDTKTSRTPSDIQLTDKHCPKCSEREEVADGE